MSGDVARARKLLAIYIFIGFLVFIGWQLGITVANAVYASLFCAL